MSLAWQVIVIIVTRLQVPTMLTFSIGVNQLLQLELVLSGTHFSGVKMKDTNFWQPLAIRQRQQTGKLCVSYIFVIQYSFDMLCSATLSCSIKVTAGWDEHICPRHCFLSKKARNFPLNTPADGQENQSKSRQVTENVPN